MVSPPFLLGVVVGFAAVLVLASLFDKVGTVMFRRGMVKPFYVLGRRIHHRGVLYFAFPAIYALVVSLIMLGFIHVIWSAFSTGIETTLAIAVGCFVVDLLLDGVSFGVRDKSFLHHEWIYLLIPAYAFTHVLTVLP